MRSGQGLLNLIQHRSTYNDIVHPKPNVSHSTWAGFIKNYFSPAWNGNPSNAKHNSYYEVFSGYFLKFTPWDSIFQTAFNNGWIQGSNK